MINIVMLDIKYCRKDMEDQRLRKMEETRDKIRTREERIQEEQEATRREREEAARERNREEI